jgi:hypothetical protein
MRVTLNLATRPRRSGQASRAGVVVLVGLTLVATLWVATAAWRTWQGEANPAAQAVALRSRLNQLARERQEHEARLRAPAARAVLERVGFYNQLLERKAVTWAELFVALEQHLPERARILAVRPEVDERGALRLELRVGAESPLLLVQFLQRLEQSPQFREVAVRSGQRSERAGDDPIVAEVIATYQGVSR